MNILFCSVNQTYAVILTYVWCFGKWEIIEIAVCTCFAAFGGLFTFITITYL